MFTAEEQEIIRAKKEKEKLRKRKEVYIKKKLRVYYSHKVTQHQGIEPEIPDRVLRIIAKIEQKLKTVPIIRDYGITEDIEQYILQVHDPYFIQAIKNRSVLEKDSANIIIQGVCMNTKVTQYTYDAILYAVSAILQAIIDVTTMRYLFYAFCNIRPPGHHAEAHRCGGFCIVNNVAIGAKFALSPDCGYTKVGIVDFDVHHGNGTEQIVLRDDRMFYGSVYDPRLYPFGSKLSPINSLHSERVVRYPVEGKDSVPSRDEFRRAWTNICLSLVQFFKQGVNENGIVFISAGFDGSKNDFNGTWKLEDEDYKWVTEELLTKLKVNNLHYPVISVLEGGYNTSTLPSTVVEHIKPFVEFDYKKGA